MSKRKRQLSDFAFAAVLSDPNNIGILQICNEIETACHNSSLNNISDIKIKIFLQQKKVGRFGTREELELRVYLCCVVWGENWFEELVDNIDAADNINAEINA